MCGIESRSRHPIPALVAVLVLMAVAAIQMLALRTPESVPASAPAEEFSAERAMTHIERFAESPRPTGTLAHDRVRDYLAAQLQALGLDAEVESGGAVASADEPGSTFTVGARTDNVVARIPGSAPTGTVVLLAHYDSAPNSHGASENGYSVASILEIARALAAGPAPQNTVEILLSDAEEVGMLGAQAYVDVRGLDPKRTVVLNQETRGYTGPTTMFRSSSDNARLIDALASAPRPVAGSEVPVLVDLMPSNTEFDVFSPAGFGIMEFGNQAGSVTYDSGSDTLAKLDPEALQHRGDTVLATVEALAAQDLTASAGEPTTFFTVAGVLISYPQSLGVPLALVAVVAVVALLVLQRRSACELRLRGVGVAAASVVGLTIAVAVIGYAAWRVLLLVHPGYGSFLIGDTHRPGWHAAGMLLLAGALTVGWYSLLRRRLTADEVVAGLWVVMATVAVVVALAAPGAAYPFTWPPLLGAVSGMIGVRLTRWHPVAPVVGGIAAIALLLPNTDVSAFGLAGAGFPMAVLAVMIVPALPLLEQIVHGIRGIAPLAAATAVALFAVGSVVDTFGPADQRHTDLTYAYNADVGAAHWISTDPYRPEWTAGYATTLEPTVEPWLPADPALGLGGRVHAGPAPVAAIEEPIVAITETPRGEDRTVRITVAPHNAYRLLLHVDGNRLAGAVVDGRPIRPGPLPNWSLHFTAPPPSGLDIELTIRGPEPLPVRVTGLHLGLSDVPGFQPPPVDVTWGQGLANNTSAITRTHHV